MNYLKIDDKEDKNVKDKLVFKNSLKLFII